MNKIFLVAASLLAAIAVISGAFAAHALKEKITPEQVQTFETAVRYQFYHVFALVAAGMLYKEFHNKFIKWSGYLFIAGIFLFSGSLYVLSLATSLKVVGIITPFGGACFIAGWVFLAIGLTNKTKEE
jgi:uncharacterized membrane protein YgdD (TMEM256/DUF423 family)